MNKVYLVTVHWHYDGTDIDSAHASEITAWARRDELEASYSKYGKPQSVDVDVLEMDLTQARNADPCES